MKKKKKVVVAFSGGKDSTSAVITLKEQGYHVETLTMRMGLDHEDEKLQQIKHLADVLQVPNFIVDVQTTFQEKVIDYFVRAYAANFTPNPCAVCNVEIKFDLLLNEALYTRDADFYATGHYADKTCINGEWFLLEPEDQTKSQIYFLSLIGKDALKHVLFPISRFTVADVRLKVKNLPLANKEESQDVCFLGKRKLIDFLKEYLPPAYFKPGDILNVEGNKIGRHQGAVYFTVGQRRGTGFSSDRKLYVVKKDVQANTITLGEKKELFSTSVRVFHPVFWRPIKVGEEFQAKFRYMSRFYPVMIQEVDQNLIKAGFPEPVSSLTPGQIAAFYDGNMIVAAGFISG